MIGINVGRLFNPSLPNFSGISHIYRKAITVTNSSGGTLTNYQVHIQTDTATPIAAGKMKPDCSDLRIYNSDATTLLNFWIDPDTINTSTTDIWVKVPSLTAGSYTLYLYYGGNTTFTSSISNTFIYGDDFSTNTIGNYTVSAGSPVVDTTNKWLHLPGTGNVDIRIGPTTQTDPASYIVESKAAITIVAGDCFAGLYGFKTTIAGNTGYSPQFGNLSSVRSLDIEKTGVAHLVNTAISFTDGQFYPLKATFLNGSITGLFNNTTSINSTDAIYTSGLYGMRGYNADVYHKYFRVRAYTGTEPTSSVGSETLVS